MNADVVVFDGETLNDTASYQDPHQYPRGILSVLVNGEVVVRQGKHTQAKSGKLLVRQSDR